ncbi:MAG TPA: hypothetical protein VG268_04670, partial [Streptosporangiaceae bacterium]|nr:hypothetical protein [Streptosporangiaceae bacterium]
MTKRNPIATLRWPQRVTRALREALTGALCGLLAAAVALGVAELVAAITGPRGSPVVAVGGSAIDLTPIPVKDFAIVHFGSHDKTVLVTGILVLLAVFAAVIGILARRWLAVGLAGLVVFGVLGVSATLSRPDASAADVAPTLVGVVLSMITLIILVRTARDGKITLRRPAMAAPPEPAVVPRIETVPVETVPGASEVHESDVAHDAGGPGRRGFLVASAGAAVVATAGGAGGELLLRRFSVTGSRAQVRLPAAARAARAAPAGAELKIPGLSSFHTPNSSFYRVDTDLVL